MTLHAFGTQLADVLGAPDDALLHLFEQLERRARAARRRAFHDADMWPSNAAYQTTCCEQVVRGDDLARSLVAPIIGDELGQFLYPLADAYELGASATELAGGSAAQRAQVGELFVMFAVSCSLFEALELSHLTELLAAITERRPVVIETARDDAKLALAAIAWTLEHLQPLISQTGGDESSLATALTAALRAEVRARVCDIGSEWTFVEAARLRFELPFTVLREIVIAVTHANSIATKLDEVFSSLAAICFRTADLGNVVTALRGGRLNSIAAIAGATPTRAPNAAKIRVIAARLAKLDVIESAGHQLWASATRALQLLATQPRLRAVLDAFARRSIT